MEGPRQDVMFLLSVSLRVRFSRSTFGLNGVRWKRTGIWKSGLKKSLPSWSQPSPLPEIAQMEVLGGTIALATRADTLNKLRRVQRDVKIMISVR